MPRYDYIFTGTGAAALSLLVRMIRSGKFSDKKILLTDRAPKTSNDRTWCFWEYRDGFFENVVHHKWKQLLFFSNSFSAPLQIAPYEYKMIRGIDFYNYCFDIIRAQSNIEIQYGEINLSLSRNQPPVVLNGNHTIDTEGAVIFNSIYKEEKKPGTIHLLQHFKGYLIEAPGQQFDTSCATLMDFRVSQKEGATFVYVLPVSPNRLLVEYTLFTGSLLERKEYDEQLKSYIHNTLKIHEYTVLEEEFGIIPMTNASFSFSDRGVFNIGTAGGQTKASSGYTFSFIQKQSENILQALIAGKPLNHIHANPARFQFYDSVLLYLLDKGHPPGDEIFARLFSRNKAADIFRFLDNETSLGPELKLISTLQFWPFLKAAANIKLGR